MLLTGFIVFFLYKNTSNENKNVNKKLSFDKKIELLHNNLILNSEVKDLINNESRVVLSISDTKSQAIVKYKKSNTIEEAINSIKNEVSTFCKNNDFNAKWIKLDYLIDLESMPLDDFCDLLSNVNSDYSFRKGLIIPYNNSEIVTTEAELNFNKILDYDNFRCC